ncbi:lipid particle protein [Moniliophthora roreri MCA 2997]|uniref:Lipid particle protein n=1 Tax=Moniliophthora roreri (strain MCA 2997) TaxID=1381753 RepID=V2XXJ5_MONRO|nr:lipid particle protein [Moniliophthora roreri MCA 2997]KAI3597796.1 lipid particle protein [Moniliophthora roreri]
MDSVHLLTLVHGMWGNPSHLRELERTIKEREVTDIPLHVIVARTNAEDSTYDGIDWGGERVAKEVIDEVEQLQSDGKKVVKFSITGYSLGGLVSRYVVGILYQKGFFKDVAPVNFNTIATPHLGLPRYPSILSSLYSTLGPKLLSRTGEQFYCVDKWSNTGKPLLEVMADPEFVFYKALASFQHARIYANAIYDTTVPYVTAAIETEDPFADHAKNGIEIKLDENYKPIIKSYSLPPVPPAPTPKPVILSPSWFQQRKNKKPSLPPFLKFRFPLNIVFYAMLPILIPVILALTVIRLSRDARSSRARIKELEKDATHGQSLARVLAQLEREVEGAVVELMDEAGSGSTSTLQGTEISIKVGKKSKEPAALSPLQHKIAEQLNTLPLKKELAFIDGVFNSHGTIIMRDVKRFPFQIAGEGVVRHWADSLII